MPSKLIPELVGKPGPAGPGLPLFGNKGCLAVKSSGLDYDITWRPATQVSSVIAVEPAVTTASEFLFTTQGDLLLL